MPTNRPRTLSSRPPAKKYWSQNFLIDPNVKTRILNACALGKDDIVLEIGPGHGALTERVAEKVRHLYAVERDPSLCAGLREKLSPNRVTIIEGDFLKFDWDILPEKAIILGNIPYHISTLIIEKLISRRHQWEKSFLMVQKEFGDRLAAKPNTKDYGSLTCFVQYYCHVDTLLRIKPTAFRPVPKVTSAFLRLTSRPFEKKARDEEFLFRLIRTAFAQRRKKIGNALSPLISKGALEDILKQCRIPLDARPENIPLGDYVMMADLFCR